MHWKVNYDYQIFNQLQWKMEICFVYWSPVFLWANSVSLHSTIKGADNFLVGAKSYYLVFPKQSHVGYTYILEAMYCKLKQSVLESLNILDFSFRQDGSYRIKNVDEFLHILVFH